MSKKDLVVGVLLLGVSAYTAYQASNLPIGRLGSPQAGFFPLLLAALLAVLALIILGQSAIKGKNREKNQVKTTFVEPGNWKRVIVTLGTLFAFVVFFEFLGFLISTFLLIAFLLWGSGTRKYSEVALVASLTSLISYLIFIILLKTPLPSGILGTILGG